jgi:hypothetical protein
MRFKERRAPSLRSQRFLAQTLGSSWCLQYAQMRCVGRQVLHFQPAVLVTDELLRDCTFVSRKPIPNHQDVSLDDTAWPKWFAILCGIQLVY